MAAEYRSKDSSDGLPAPVGGLLAIAHKSPSQTTTGYFSMYMYTLGIVCERV